MQTRVGNWHEVWCCEVHCIHVTASERLQTSCSLFFKCLSHISKCRTLTSAPFYVRSRIGICFSYCIHGIFYYFRQSPEQYLKVGHLRIMTKPDLLVSWPTYPASWLKRWRIWLVRVFASCPVLGHTILTKVYRGFLQPVKETAEIIPVSQIRSRPLPNAHMRKSVLVLN